MTTNSMYSLLEFPDTQYSLRNETHVIDFDYMRDTIPYLMLMDCLFFSICPP